MKTDKSESYLIKGLRGSLRHQLMSECLHHGIEVCHTSDKETDKHGRSLLPEGFHLIGSCKHNGECVMHQIFGSMGNEGLISIYADPITSINQKTAKPHEQMQIVQIATENRIALTHDGKSIQDFGERYFSGYFNFEIDVTRCSPEQLGLIVNGVMNLQRLGRGFNSGYGRIKVKEFQLLHRTITRTPKWKGDSFIITEAVEDSSEKNQ